MHSADDLIIHTALRVCQTVTHVHSFGGVFTINFNLIVQDKKNAVLNKGLIKIIILETKSG